MTLRDMTPDELELFEESILEDTDEPRLTLDTGKPEVAREEREEEEVDRDKDGLPDGPAERRVPS